MNVREERVMPAEVEIAFALIESLPPHKQVGFAITLLAMVADDNSDNNELNAAGYVHTGCKVQNAINFLTALTSDHTSECPRAKEPGRAEIEA